MQQDYQFKTKPFEHQLKAFEATKDTNRYGLFWEMGCGKTKPTIDTFSRKMAQGEVETVIVLAPNGVHTNWISDELPAHCPFGKELLTLCWDTQKVSTKWFQEEALSFLKTRRPRVLAMNYDAIMTKFGDRIVSKLLEHEKTFLILDESQFVKNPNAKRTKRILSYVRYAQWRRILTGTPITNNPFDVYSQLKCLDLGYWKAHGLDNFATFKKYFGVFESKHYGDREVELVVAFQNLDQLAELVALNTSRLLKEDVLTLPPKLYTKRYFDMNPTQRRVYDDMRKDFLTWLDGEMVTAELAIVRMQRLQQITSGYLPSDDGETIHQEIGGENTRLKCLEDLIEEVPHQGIIWAKYTRDIQSIAQLLGKDCVTYYGGTSNEDRLKARQDFRAGKVKWFIGNPDAAGTGLTLVEAKTVIYYNTGHKLASRLQSEDRAHRIGQKDSVAYVDLIANNSVDGAIVNALVSKFEIASMVLGDKIRSWI